MGISGRLLFAAAVSALASTAASAAANFDELFAGFDHACKSPPAFEAFWNSVIEKYGEDGKPSHRLLLPAPLAASVGPATAKDMGGYIDVRMAVDGTFRGLRLSKVVFALGKGNGISLWRLEFAEPPRRVRSVLGAAVARGKKQMAAEDDAGIGITTGLDFENGTSAVYCDFSS